MNTSSARDGKEMSTTVNRCSHLDEHISKPFFMHGMHSSLSPQAPPAVTAGDDGRHMTMPIIAVAAQQTVLAAFSAVKVLQQGPHLRIFKL
jgi:hypothetical protein